MKFPSQFHRSLRLSFPNVADADEGLASGTITQAQHAAITTAHATCKEPPQTTALGSLIEIHGAGGGPDLGDWTLGCVALDNDLIEQVFAFHEPGCDPNNAPKTLVRIDKVTKELANEGGCEADKATPAADQLTPYVVVAALGGTMGQSQITGCGDPAACAQMGEKVAAGDSVSAGYMMPLDKRGKESSQGTILHGGKHEGGKCTGVFEERVTLTESGATGRIETTKVVYEDYAGEDSHCSAFTARKKKIAETCKSLRVMDLERAATP